MDNPFANNTTPSWGHVGAVTGCTSALEVSQPVDGVYFSWQAPNGNYYHLANLAYQSWFYRQVPSIGLNGQYDMNSDLTSAAAPCS